MRKETEIIRYFLQRLLNISIVVTLFNGLPLSDVIVKTKPTKIRTVYRTFQLKLKTEQHEAHQIQTRSVAHACTTPMRSLIVI